MVPKVDKFYTDSLSLVSDTFTALIYQGLIQYIIISLIVNNNNNNTNKLECLSSIN